MATDADGWLIDDRGAWLAELEARADLLHTAAPRSSARAWRSSSRMTYAPRVTAAQEKRIAERFQMALDLYDLSERMLRQKLRRQHPDASAAELDAKVGEWLARRPGAEHGDAEGTPLTWPRRRA